jgi:hypothetical protein
MSVTYVNKNGEYTEVSPCFTRIEDLELPDLNVKHPNELKYSIKSLLANPIKIPPIIFNPIFDNIQIRNELEKEKNARLILEERVKKLENAVVRPTPTDGCGRLLVVSKGEYIEVSPYLGKFDDLGLTCPPPKDKKPYKRESTGWH